MERKIVLLATGGTIASTGRAEKGNLTAKLKGEELTSGLPGISDIGMEVVVENFSTVNSANIAPSAMVKMAQRVSELLDKEDVASVVITHGTSLMEETAFILDLLVTHPKKPVVITGAQRNVTYPWPDGNSNLNDALRIAASPSSAGMGVMVAFCGYIHEGFRVRKTHSLALDAFSSGEYGALGSLYYNNVRFFRSRVRKHLPFKTYEPRSVAIIPFYSGADGRYIRAAIDSGEDGIVVEGVGVGNVNGDYYEEIKEARQRGLPVVVTSRCLYGHLIPLYAYKGGGASLQKLGVLSSDLPSPKARLLLMLALGGGCSPDKLAECFI